MKAILSFLLLAAAILAAGPAPAARYAAVVIDADSGAVLHGERSTARRYPASLDQDDDGLSHFSSGFAAASTSSRPHEGAAPRDLAAAVPARPQAGLNDHRPRRHQALVVKSANDVATTVAYFIAGSERKFARVMNRKAEQLGMRHTSFRNASGLWHSKQWTQPATWPGWRAPSCGISRNITTTSP